VENGLLGPGLVLFLWMGGLRGWMLASRLPVLRALRAGEEPLGGSPFPRESPLALGTVWVYVAFRVAHPFGQVRHDRVPTRSAWSLMESVALFVLTASILWTWLA
jgi:hypothetical protein